MKEEFAASETWRVLISRRQEKNTIGDTFEVRGPFRVVDDLGRLPLGEIATGKPRGNATRTGVLDKEIVARDSFRCIGSILRTPRSRRCRRWLNWFSRRRDSMSASTCAEGSYHDVPCYPPRIIGFKLANQLLSENFTCFHWWMQENECEKREGRLEVDSC